MQQLRGMQHWLRARSLPRSSHLDRYVVRKGVTKPWDKPPWFNRLFERRNGGETFVMSVHFCSTPPFFYIWNATPLRVNFVFPAFAHQSLGARSCPGDAPLAKYVFRLSVSLLWGFLGVLRPSPCKLMTRSGQHHEPLPLRRGNDLGPHRRWVPRRWMIEMRPSTAT